jgi:hypothetical protein
MPGRTACQVFQGKGRSGAAGESAVSGKLIACPASLGAAESFGQTVEFH